MNSQKKQNRIVLFFACLVLTTTSCSKPGQRSLTEAPVISNHSQNDMLSKIKGNSAFDYILSRKYLLAENYPAALNANLEALKKDPESTYLRASYAELLVEDQKLEKAQEEAEKVLQQQPQEAKYHLLLAQIYSLQHNHHKAIQYYDSCLKFDPEDENCILQLAKTYMLLDKKGTAISSLQKFIQKNPQSLTALSLLAYYYQKENKLHQAKLTYQKMLEVDPSYLPAAARLAQIYLKQKQKKQALELLLQLERNAARDVSTQLKIGILFYDLKQFEEAILRFRRVLQLSPYDHRIRYYLGLLEAENKNYTMALKHLEEIPEGTTFYQDAQLRRMSILSRKEEFDKAIAIGENILLKYPDNSDVYESLSNIYFKKSEISKAFKILEKGLSKFPENVELLFAKALLLEDGDKWEESILVMKQILKVQPDHSSALNFIGYSYAERGVQLTEAIQLLKKALSLDPGSGHIMDSLGWAYFQAGNTHRALNLILKAETLEPNEPEILFHLGVIHTKLNQKAKAIRYYEQIVEILKESPPENSRGKKLLQETQENLEKLKASH